jgi:hypothetical protein
MATQKQIEANRRNAQRSTGPRTDAASTLAPECQSTRPLPKAARLGSSLGLVLPLARAIAVRCHPTGSLTARSHAVESLTYARIRRRRVELMVATATLQRADR